MNETVMILTLLQWAALSGILILAFAGTTLALSVGEFLRRHVQ